MATPAIAMVIVTSVACAPEQAQPIRFSDSIPWESLGGGRLVMERIAKSGSYSGVGVLNIARQSARWTDPGVFHGAAVSPEGTRIAFSRPTDSNTFWDVWIMDIDGAGARVVAGAKDNDCCPTWSPDGRLYYTAYTAPDTTIVGPGIALGVPRHLHQDDRVSVAVDGRIALAGAGADPRSISIWEPGAPGFRSIRPDVGDADIYSPTWSPDGSTIAFLTVAHIPDHRLSTSLWVVDGAGRELRAIVTGLAGTWTSGGWAGSNGYSVCWSPDGGKLAFNWRQQDLVGHVFVVNVDGSGLVQVTTEADAYDRSLSWSP